MMTSVDGDLYSSMQLNIRTMLGPREDNDWSAMFDFLTPQSLGSHDLKHKRRMLF